MQSLKEYIDKGDVLLLEWAGVPEDEEDECPECGSTTEIHKNSSDQIMCDNCGYCEGDEDEDNLSEEE